MSHKESVIEIALILNGKRRQVDVNPMETLLYVLRERLGLKGTKGACLEGRCGSCTILLDGVAVNSCILLAPQASEREIITIEGLSGEKEWLHSLQEAFIEAGAVQCGYCTPGFILAAKSFVEHHPGATEEEIRTSLSGNICRCTGYMKIVEAIAKVTEGQR